MTDDEILTVVQARKNGRKIERECAPGIWCEVPPSETWNFVYFVYRVKPETLVFYANVYENRSGKTWTTTHATQNDCVEARINCSTMCVRQAVKMVEAIAESQLNVMIATLQQELSNAYALDQSAPRIESVVKQLQELKRQIC